MHDISFRKKNGIIYCNLFVSTIVLLLINLMDLHESFSFMLFYGIVIALFYGILLLLEIKYFRGLSLNLPLLVGYCTRVVLPTIEKSWGAMDGDLYYFLIEQNDITDYMFPTAVWMNIYYMIFLWCLNRFTKHYTIEESIKPFFIKYKIVRLAIPLFAIGTAYSIVASFVPAGLIPGVISNLFGKLATFAIFLQMFDALFNQTKNKKRIFVIFIVISIWQSVVFGFYKGVVMTNIVYYILYLFLDSKYNNKNIFSAKFVVACASIFLVLDLVLYPFMETKRVVAGWDVTGAQVATVEYSNWKILQDVLSGNSVYERGQVKTSGRLDAIPPNAFFYKECCKKGLRTKEVAKSNIELLVPRFINPNKHHAEAGHMTYAYAVYGSFNSKELAVSNNYIGQFASAYLIGGWLFVLFAAFINGCFTIYFYNFLIKYNRNILSILFLIPLLFNALLAYEEVHDAGALNIGYNIVMMIGIFITTKLAPGVFCIRKKI